MIYKVTEPLTDFAAFQEFTTQHVWYKRNIKIKKDGGEKEKAKARFIYVCNLDSLIKSLKLPTPHKPPGKKTTAPLPISCEILYCFFRLPKRVGK